MSAAGNQGRRGQGAGGGPGKGQGPEAYERALQDGAAQLGIPLSQALREGMVRHHALVLQWAAKINLTAIKDPVEAARLHGLDSLLFAELIPEDASVDTMDVGSGAGFPGLVVALARPVLRMTLLEPARKRASFLRVALAELGRADVVVREGRLEDAGPKAGEDAGPKAGEDAGPKAGEDAGPKAGEDAGPKAGEDAGPKAGEDAGPKAGEDARWGLIISRATLPPLELVARAGPRLRPGGRLIVTSGRGAPALEALAGAGRPVGLVHRGRHQHTLPGGEARILDVLERLEDGGSPASA